MKQLPDIDDRPLSFGKYRGKTPNQVGDYDPSYICWMFENIPDSCSAALYEVCRLDEEAQYWEEFEPWDDSE